jgi:hypothetical protein
MFVSCSTFADLMINTMTSNSSSNMIYKLSERENPAEKFPMDRYGLRRTLIYIFTSSKDPLGLQ